VPPGEVVALYELTKSAINALNETTFAAQDVNERSDLQRLLKSHIEVIAPDILIIAEEFCEWDESKRRIDLIGVDRGANLVVVELKRTEDGGHMELQAVRYAAMISAMRFSKAVEIYRGYLGKNNSTEDAETALLEFLNWDVANEDTFGQDVRIVLVSAEFSKEITTSVLWLNDHGLDIRCVRLRPYVLENRVILDVQQVIPLPEAESYMVQITKKAEENRQAKRVEYDWKAILTGCRNDAVTEFFRERLDAGQHNRPAKKGIIFLEAGGKNGWLVQVQQDAAHVIQIGRFNGDCEFWRQKISQPATVRLREPGREILVFKLHTQQDLAAFQTVMETQAASIQLVRTPLDQPYSDKADPPDTDVGRSS
jgi:hypothetical protein